ncbi:MAG: bifunctional glutamate N-acetyltransferase/amino-acid acetyltransferase ArgJ [Synechococcaceae cyanobacterium SM2_3_1]|nr:bifunctional glutamate N-acetyltransferase/amino-acid acetyltransferase ArgJ [Synechococcaceae cyanobacterium SM2_3_1]
MGSQDNPSWQEIAGGVTAPRGYRAAGVAAGLKPSGAPDLALIVSDVEAVAAGVVTTNQVKAACVTYAQQILEQGTPVRAILCNAGQANACTGGEGVEDNFAMARSMAEQLGIAPEQVLTASTGVIGQRLALDRLQAALPRLVDQLSYQGNETAARAILTTDLTVKTVAYEAMIAGVAVRVGGMAKGSGMIHPQMATMLAFITCDAQVEATLWRQIVQRAADLSFNQITVDGDTSTNDLFLALANGQADGPLIEAGTDQAALLEAMLAAAAIKLAKAIARDGEGATKLLEVQVQGAGQAEEARRIARVITGSPLVKSAAFGCDPNWGRVLAAAGRAGVSFAGDQVDVFLGPFQLMAAGKPLAFDRPAASAYLKENDPVIYRLHLHQGSAEGVAWGCDLSYDYVRINAEYTT